MNPDNNSNPPTGKSRDEEVFEMGSVAVVHADGQNPAPAAPSVPPVVSKVAALAISKADERLLEPGEHLVTVVRRHPIGIVAIYAEMLTGIVAVIVIVLLAMFAFFTHLSSSTKGLIAAGSVFVIAFLVALLLIATYVYRQCRLVVTNKSVVQIMQKALFNRKISRLSMSNVEDVNVIQQGVLASIFNYGTLTIQTAGEVDNFVFTLCPNPDVYANRILEARQAYARAYADEHEN